MYFQSECSDFRDGNMEWLHLGMVLIMEEETLGLGKDHSKVYWTDGKNIAGYYLRLDWEIEQQRNCFLTLAADRTRMPLNLAEMITVGTHVCNDCHGNLISFLLYWFRISMPKYVRTVGFKQYRSLSKQVVRFMFFNI
ncbi:hypothetical protein BDE02_19G002400 [Populus trichocarpa]|nr:hypothetical protein BDE02_19G002400 [Populus trichocarpa]